METMHQVNQIFSGFISGKLLDSLIVGIICFVCLTILQMPYALLVSVIVGVTNIIPMFGPFIGAIPSAFLVLLVSPTKCLIFLIFIIILQQLDGKYYRAAYSWKFYRFISALCNSSNVAVWKVNGLFGNDCRCAAICNALLLL